MRYVEYDGDDPAMQSLADNLNALARNTQVGYQGRVRLKKVISIPLFDALDGPEAGEDMVLDLAQATDGTPDLAVRKWITVRGEEAGGRELVRPGNPKMQGPFDILKALAGGGPLGGLAIDFLQNALEAKGRR